MEKITYCANLDFDLHLKDRKKSSEIILKEWEWLPLWIEGKIKGRFPYDQNYLDWVKTFQPNLSINPFWPEKEWWNNDEDNAKNQILNSKKTCLQCKNDLHLNTTNGKWLESIEDKRSGNYLYKDEYSFAGKRVGSNNLNYPCIEEEKIFIQFEFSSYGKDQDKYFYLNEVDQHNQYVGTYLSPNFFLDSGLFPFLEEAQKIDNQIRNWYSAMGASYSFSVDYMMSKDRQIVFNEVNYRKTMGFIALQFHQRLGYIQEWSFLGRYPHPHNKKYFCLTPAHAKIPYYYSVLESEESIKSIL